ncbi:MAG: VOC family protein [Maribacter sp.]|nr:VOC family protein [Maribacter sp.]
MKNTIYPCIWFNGTAKEAAEFYSSVFKGCKITSVNPIVVLFEIDVVKFMGLNGGPKFKPNATLSFYVTCETESEIDSVWQKLMVNGQARMPLVKYAWSEKYGWVEDQYGVSWQLALGKVKDMGQKVVPAMLFNGQQFGRGQEALDVYTKIFKESKVNFIFPYEASDKLQGGKIAHAQFTLLGQKFILMDSGHIGTIFFNEGLSMVVGCDTQEEIDYYWNLLTEGGSESRCGWLKDKFGFSWQIVPTILGTLMNDTKKADRTMQVIMKSIKFNIKELLQS